MTLSSSEAEFVAASQAGKEVLYLRALLKGFACPQTRPTELWEDNASCILMSENPTNRERSRHVDVRVHFLRDMVRDGAVKLIKCAGTQNVADALTKSRQSQLSTSIANSCMAQHSLSLLSLRAHAYHLLQRMSLVCLCQATCCFPKPLVGVSVGE